MKKKILFGAMAFVAVVAVAAFGTFEMNHVAALDPFDPMAATTHVAEVDPIDPMVITQSAA